METEKFQRKPFMVDAVRVTRENLEQVCRWCDGELKTTEGQEPFIYVRVAAPMSERSKQAMIGDWVVYMSATGFKVFSHKSFKRNFEAVFKQPLNAEMEKTVDKTQSISTHQHTHSIFDNPPVEAEDLGLPHTLPGPGQKEIIDTLAEATIPAESTPDVADNAGESQKKENDSE